MNPTRATNIEHDGECLDCTAYEKKIDRLYAKESELQSEVASLTSELKELKEENERLNHEAEKWKAASDQHYENWSNGVSKIAELIKENERLRGTIGAEAVRQNLELKEENKMMIDVLRNNHEFVLRLYTRLSSLIDESGLQDIRTELANMQSALSKHQPIKKDESTK